MQEILAQQRNAAKPVTGKAFLFGVVGIVVKLALVQLLVNLAIMLTGIGLLNIAFYLSAIGIIVSFMRRTVAGSLYMLKEETLYLQKTLGDSTTSVTEIPLERILSVRRVAHGERLESSYQRVTVIDSAAFSPMRMRLAFGLSLVSAALARRIAGEKADKERGTIVVYEDEGKRCVCLFLPDEAFMQALCAKLPDLCGIDERNAQNTPVTMMAQALERAFPHLYAHVPTLVPQEMVQQAKEEIAAQKRARKAKNTSEEITELRKQEEAGVSDEVQDDTL